MLVIPLVISVFLTIFLTYLYWTRYKEIKFLKSKHDTFQEENTHLKVEIAKLEAQYREWKIASEEKITLLEGAREKLLESFKALSLESLEKNSQTFLTLAHETMQKFHEKTEGDLSKKTIAIQELFSPVKESLSKLNEGMVQLEKERKGDQASLKEQIKNMISTEKELKEETALLVRALRTPHVRGRWGEMQLKRVVELCGMVSHCDFFEQQQEETLRPDMVIRLPGGKQVIVDAKTPFEAYFDAMQENDEQKKTGLLQLHAKHLRAHVSSLSKKAYWENFEPTPEFVVLFLPSEGFFSAALEQDPSLIEMGVEQKVVIATPMTLIGLLKAVAYGWKQERISKHTKEIYNLGKELYKRLGDVQQHIGKIGKSLSASVDSYNKMVGSLESRVLVSARKFESLGIGEEEGLPLMTSIDERPKEFIAIE